MGWNVSGARRIRALAAAGMLALCAAALAPLWTGASRPPLVLVVVFDALRADHLSQYGYALPTSPGLERLARDGTVFTHAYAPSSYTTASTASLLTGQSPLRHGTRRQGTRLAADAHTLAELLAEAGYTGLGVSFNPVVAHATGFGQGFRDFAEREAGSPFNLYPDITQGLDRIRSWLGGAHPGPRFVYFQPMNTHGPYLVPRESASVLLGRPPRAEFRYYGQPMAAILQGDVASRSSVTPAYVASAIERYDTAIRYSTDQLGRFLDELEAAGRLDEALVVVTADHGDEFFEHGGFSHGYTLHEEVIRVPLLVKLPGQSGARRIEQRVSILDVYPTIAEIAGVRIGHEVDGASLVPLIRGRVEGAPRPLQLVADFLPRLRARGLIEGSSKLVAVESRYDAPGPELRLYDLEADPKELQNLAASQPARLEALVAQLGPAARSDRPGGVEPVPELDRERLAALGYAIE